MQQTTQQLSKFHATVHHTSTSVLDVLFIVYDVVVVLVCSFVVLDVLDSENFVQDTRLRHHGEEYSMEIN